MPRTKKPKPPTTLVETWPLSPAATLGSSVRAKGILLEVRARLSRPARKLVHVEGAELTLRIPQDALENTLPDLSVVSKEVSAALQGIEALPVLPREIEDILTIKTSERHRWLKDGRLKSAGTRTVKLRGRARKITFHVFDPRHIEDVLDRDSATVWREDDALTAAENRRRGAGRAALTRAKKKAAAQDDTEEGGLQGWEEFDREGLLR